MDLAVDRRGTTTTRDRLYGALASVVFGGIQWGARIGGAAPDELRQRAGWLPEAPGPVVWFHGASAGEIAAATALAAALRDRGHRFVAAFTAANRAGVEVARRGGGDLVAAVPWDSPRWVARAFDRWQPRILVLVETEIWPRLVLEATRRRTPVVCVSARIYPRDVPRYRAVRAWLAPTFARLTAVLAQDDVERQRFVELGVDGARCSIGGNLKHLDPPRHPSQGAPLRSVLGLRERERLLVFGSIHADEVALVFATLDRLGSDAGRVVVAPRHERSATAILARAARGGWKATRRSDPRGANDWNLLVLDTVGELGSAYALADVAVVGGGFARHGGHNPIEPLRAGAPVLFGPHGEHFEAEARALVAALPESRVARPAEIARRIADWRADERLRRDALRRQQTALPDGMEVARRHCELLSVWLASP
jgi:3-deoxy-D-manno-octulosonic-acid transferase